MSEKKRIGGGGSQSGEPSKPLKAEGSSSKKGVQQRSQKTAASKKRPQQKPTHPPVTVRRIHGDTKGVNTGLAEESKDRGVNGGQPTKPNGPSRKNDSVSAAAFDCGPPPQLNTIKRLAKEVNGCAADLNTARDEADVDGVGSLGRRLANAKLSSSPGYAAGLAKAAARKVDYEGDERVFTSLANLSVANSSSSSTQGDGLVGLAWKKTGASKRDPELKLENYFTPYQGQDFTYTPHSKDAVLDLVKPCPRPPRKPFRIQDHVDL